MQGTEPQKIQTEFGTAWFYGSGYVKVEVGMWEKMCTKLKALPNKRMFYNKNN